MATIFMSYQSGDRGLADTFRTALQKKGHEIRFDAQVAGDDWRKELANALRTSDAVLALLSDRRSDFVASEIGSARALAASTGILLLPVVVGQREIPPFIQDIFAVRLLEKTPILIKKAVHEIDSAITKHVERLRGKYPRIFISHRHKDRSLAAALVRLLERALGLGKGDIRCTSVPPYKLPVGERTPDRLKAEIARAKVVMGIVTPDTSESSYVLFELGAAWGQGVLTFPLLAKGGTMAHIPAPISDRHPLTLSDPVECKQLIEDLADATGASLTQIDIADVLATLASAAVESDGARLAQPFAQPGDVTGPLAKP